MSLINREALIAEYDRVHVGSPGGARKLMVDAPEVMPEPKWIPCSEQMPEEHDSIFKRYYGTDKWRNTMFQSSSKKVITTCEFADGTRFTETDMTCDGKWRTDEYPPRTVIAWMPLPEPYREGGN